MSEIIRTIPFKYTENDFVAAYSGDGSQKAASALMFVICAACSLNILFAVPHAKSIATFLIEFAVPICIIVFGSWFWFSLRQQPRRTFRNGPQFQTEFVFEFSSVKLTWQSGLTQGEHDWSIYKHILDLKDQFVLRQKQSNVYIVLPKRAFADNEDLQRFRHLIPATVPFIEKR